MLMTSAIRVSMALAAIGTLGHARSIDAAYDDGRAEREAKFLAELDKEQERRRTVSKARYEEYLRLEAERDAPVITAAQAKRDRKNARRLAISKAEGSRP